VAQTLESQRAEARIVAQAAAKAEEAEPVTETEAREQGPSLGPGAAGARAAEAIDFTISDAGVIRVAAEETLGHYADWLRVPASRLRSLNKLSAKAAVPQGRSLKLDFSKTSRADFEARRRSFHETLQA
jgi:membrane-bound lytic murein transglycosylase D